MKQIELLAVGLFERYSHLKNGRVSNWNYLSRDRQIAWMHEVLINVDFVISELRGRLKPAPFFYAWGSFLRARI